ALQNVLAIVLADGRVSSGERDQVLAAANVAYDVVHRVHHQAGAVELGALAGKLEVASFKDAFEPLALPAPSENNLASWLNAAWGWFGDVVGTLAALCRAALDELLRAEEEVARRVRAAQAAIAAPSAASAPAGATEIAATADAT